MKRDLDGIYFRVQDEDGKWDDVCFSDLTEEQMDEMMEGRSEKWLKTLCRHLANVIKALGDDFNIVSERTYEEATKE